MLEVEWSGTPYIWEEGQRKQSESGISLYFNVSVSCGKDEMLPGMTASSALGAVRGAESEGPCRMH